MKELKKGILLVLCSMVLTGCVAGSVTDRTVVLAPTLEMTDDDLTVDQQLVLASLIERLRGNGPAEQVSFDPGGLQATTEENFKYEGFEVSNLVITGYDVFPYGEGQSRAYLDGGLLFKDVLGRRAGVQFAVDYIIREDQLIILNSAVTPRTPDHPEVQALIVPGNLEDVPAGEVENMADMYVWALDKAVPMNKATDGERFEKAQYTILVFCMDRLRAEADFRVEVTQYKSGGQQLGEMVYMGDRGWRTGVIIAEFTPNSPRSRFYIQAKYNADPENGGDTVLVGRFANKVESPAD